MDPSQVAAFAAHFQPHPPPPPQHHQQPPQQPPFSTFSGAYVHPTSGAPNPTIPQQPLPSHPSYTEMITAAILWENSQGKVSGSSKRAIAKYIDRVYSNLPPTHSALLTHHLKRLKSAGQLVMIKNSYQLPSFAPPPPPLNDTIIINNDNGIDVNVNNNNNNNNNHSGAASAAVRSDNPHQGYLGGVESSSETVKRRPGRPPKRKEPEVAVEKRGRGRPSAVKGRPQHEEVAVPFMQPVSAVGLEASNGSVGKRRGRPPKKQRAMEEVAQPVFQVEVEEQVVGPNGMPEEEGVVAVVKRRPGRPAKMEVVRGRGRPKRVEGSSAEVVVGPVSEGVVEVKKRGWPKGKPRGKKASAAAVRNVGGGGGGASYGGKKRGRKPKGSVAAAVDVVKKVYTGKPRGRPKRNSVFAKHASDKAQGLAADELLKKLEDMQSKIRDAVETIRPHVADHSAPDVLSALQQLEELSTVDVTASPTSTVVPPAPVDVTAPPPSTSVHTDLTDPATMMSFAATSGLSMPLPFSMNAPSMTVTAPFHAPSNTENHEPISWGGPNNVDS